MLEISGGLSDFINLIIACLGLLGGIPVIVSWLFKPNIKINDVDYRRWPYYTNVPIYDDEGNIVGATEQPAETVISWRVCARAVQFKMHPY